MAGPLVVGAARAAKPIANFTIDLAKSVYNNLPAGVKDTVTQSVSAAGFKAPGANMTAATATAVLQAAGRADPAIARNISMELQPFMSEPTISALVASFASDARGLVGAANAHVPVVGAELTVGNMAKVKLIKTASAVVGGAQNLLALATALNAVKPNEIAAFIENRSGYGA